MRSRMRCRTCHKTVLMTSALEILPQGRISYRSRTVRCLRKNRQRSSLCGYERLKLGRRGSREQGGCGLDTGYVGVRDVVMRVESMPSIGDPGWSLNVVFPMVVWFFAGACAMYGAREVAEHPLMSSPGLSEEDDVIEEDVFGEEDTADTPGVNTMYTKSDDIWKEAWEPLREGHSGRSGFVVQGRPFLWLQAISDDEIGTLVASAMTELQVELSSNRDTIGDLPRRMEPCSLDNVFCRAAGRAAKAWLGYIPRLLFDKQGIDESMYRNRYQMMDVKDKIPLYLSVWALLRSDMISGLPDDGETDAGSCLQLETGSSRGIGLRSWSIFEGNALKSSTSLRRRGVGNNDLLSQSPHVLQDMAICIADMVAAAYLDDVIIGLPSCSDLEAISKDTDAGSLLEVSLWPSLLDPSLNSTRDIQNFTNKLYLNRFLDEYYFRIVSIYEDKLPLFRIRRKSHSVVIQQSYTRMRRAHELSKLQGIKYAISLAIEAFDFISPLFKHCRNSFSTFCSWILKEVLGKGLGYIWEGAGFGGKRHGAKRASKKKSDSSDNNSLGISFL